MAKANLALLPVSRLVIFGSEGAPPSLINKTPFIDPKTKKPKGDPKYRATFLIPKSSDMEAVKAALLQAAKDKNPAIEYKAWKKCVKDGDAHIAKWLAKNPDKAPERMAYYKDHWFIEAKSDYKPDLSKAVNGAAVEVPDETADREFYSGCYVRAELNFVATEIDQDETVNRYISAYHNFIVKVKDGDRLGRKSRSEVFKGVLGGTSDKEVLPEDDDTAF